MKRLHHHLDIWENKLPKGFHINIKSNYKKPVDKIFEDFLNIYQLKQTDQEFFGFKKDEVIEYITKLKNKYEFIYSK